MNIKMNMRNYTDVTNCIITYKEGIFDIVLRDKNNTIIGDMTRRSNQIIAIKIDE